MQVRSLSQEDPLKEDMATREVTASSDVALAKGDPVVTTGLHAEVFTVKPV